MVGMLDVAAPPIRNTCALSNAVVRGRIETGKDRRSSSTTAAAASLNIQCDIVGADEGRVELVAGRCGRRGRHGRRRAICEDDVVRGRLRGTLPQQNGTPSSSSGGRVGARGQAPCSYVMGIGDEDNVREEIPMLLLRRLLLELVVVVM